MELTVENGRETERKMDKEREGGREAERRQRESRVRQHQLETEDLYVILLDIVCPERDV